MFFLPEVYLRLFVLDFDTLSFSLGTASRFLMGLLRSGALPLTNKFNTGKLAPVFLTEIRQFLFAVQ